MTLMPGLAQTFKQNKKERDGNLVP
jgi:hypothetical protein